MTDQTTVAPERLDHAGARRLLQRFYDLMNERDVGRIPAMFTEDAVFDDSGWPDTMHGHAEIEQFFRAIWNAMPDLTFEVLEAYAGEQPGHVAGRMRLSGTARGEFHPPGFAPTGGRVSAEYGVFYEFEGERLRRGQVIVNMQEVGVQIGALPPPGSRAEKAGVMMQRLKARSMRRRAGAA